MAEAQRREFEFGDREFRFLAGLVNARTGIMLGDNKRDMVYGRLAKRLRALKLQSFSEYCSRLEGEQSQEEMGELVNALTTNHTGFFREPHHFTMLEALLKELAADRTKTRLRLWSAASSIGAEAYSMAMCLLDAIPDAGRRDIRILATDIDTKVLDKGRAGQFPIAMAEAIPDGKRARYTRKIDADTFEVDEKLRDLVAFKPLNLLESWPMQGKFDIVFCRNVVIYFDKPTQARLFGRISDVMESDGTLFIGHSESLNNVCDGFRLIGKTTYRKGS